MHPNYVVSKDRCYKTYKQHVHNCDDYRARTLFAV